MYLFTIRSKINPKSKTAEKFPDISGAYVNCWIQFKDLEAAEQIAKLLIRERGWIPEKTTDTSIIQKKWLRKKSDQQFYSEALKYGYTLVFNMWPKDAEDANVNFEAKRKKGR